MNTNAYKIQKTIQLSKNGEVAKAGKRLKEVERGHVFGKSKPWPLLRLFESNMKFAGKLKIISKRFSEA